MNLDDRIAQLVRDAVESVMAEQLFNLEERIVQRLSEASQGDQFHADSALLTQAEVAKRLRVDSRTVRRMVLAGDFPAPVQITPSRSRWRPADIEAWLESQAQKP